MEKDTYTPNKPFLESLHIYIFCMISSVRKLAYGKIFTSLSQESTVVSQTLH